MAHPLSKVILLNYVKLKLISSQLFLSDAMKPGILVLIILLSMLGASVIFVAIFILIRRRRSKHNSDGYRSAAVTVPLDESNL